MLGGKKSHSVAKIETLIGQNTKVEGDVSFEGGLHVDGLIKGNVNCAANQPGVLTLSENGRIEGDVHVPNIILNGEVVGDVYAFERVELASQAKVKGNVYYNLIEMAIGAEVNGNLVHTKNFDEVESTEFVKPKSYQQDSADDSLENDDDESQYAQGG